MRLRELREEMELTQRVVADYLHIEQNTYSQYENGVRQIPIPLLINLALYYSVSCDYLLGITEERKPYPRSKITAYNRDKKN